MPLAEHDSVDLPEPRGTSTVSIHVPLAEHDTKALGFTKEGTVSIHVPLAEHDVVAIWHHKEREGFNSRAPRGARPTQTRISGLKLSFQFTCPSRSTTVSQPATIVLMRVSIHVPLAEHDSDSTHRAHLF